MTQDAALKLLQTVKPNPALPPLKRNKSWLLVYGDSEGKLHFYDTKYSPDAAFDRVNAAHAKDGRRTELVDVMAYTALDEAELHAKTLRDAQLTLDYYRGCISPSLLNNASAAPAAAAPSGAAPDTASPRVYELKPS
jgi:hypothetical protein